MRTKARAIEGTQGEVLYSVTAIEDVTDVKRAEFAHRLLARTGELLSHSTDYRAHARAGPSAARPGVRRLVLDRDAGGRTATLRACRAAPTATRSMFEHAERMRERYPVCVDDDAPVGRRDANRGAQRFDLTEEQLQRDRHRRGSSRGAARARDSLRRDRADERRWRPSSARSSFVNHEGSRAFDDDDLAIAVELARRAALAIENARLAEERARVADALQRELLPPSLPRMPGWEVATMYEPAGEINEVGGDFYEVFPVEDGWAVVLGDVSGKGAAAAALTAEARHTIRTAGVLSDDPRRASTCSTRTCANATTPPSARRRWSWSRPIRGPAPR